MDFERNEEQRMLDDALRRLLAQHYGFARRAALLAAGRDHSPEVWRELVALGAVAALFGPDDGGLGGAGADIALVFEALGSALSLEPLLPALVCGTLLAQGRTASQRQLRDDVVAGRRVAVLAHGEAGARYAASWVRTRAERTASGWILDGDKALVQHAECADGWLLSARTAGAAGDPAGLSLFWVPADTPGMQLHAYALHGGGRAADLVFDRLVLPADALVGEAGQAHAALEQALGAGVLAVCARALGAMVVAHRMTLEYLRTRRQFGRAIGENQVLQHRMVDVWLGIEQSRSAVLQAANALHADRRTRERALSAAKVTLCRAGRLAAEECIQFHGGLGMSWELPLSHFAKELVLLEHQFGDEDHHLKRYIALAQA